MRLAAFLVISSASMLALETSGIAQDEEPPSLNVRLGQVPTIKLAPRAPLTKEQKKEIKGLIQSIKEVESRDFGISFDAYYPDHVYFTPLPDLDSREGWPKGRYEGKPPHALQNLVEKGPDALPFLLDALEDKRPTRFKLEIGVGIMSFGEELDGNPLNGLERRVLSKSKPRVQDEENQRRIRSYQLRVGDICFVAIGQIVGRSYHAIEAFGLGSPGGYHINSPIHSEQMREQIRAVWSSQDPARKLIDSLLLDYSTQGKFNGKSLKGWDEGSNRQVDAVVRLLYYFPKETTPLITARLRSLNVEAADFQDDLIKREVKNGVRTAEFIKAVCWCREPEIQKALNDIAKRTDAWEIKEALKNRGKSDR
jgi:hypothetical protein